jgi:hypothetical protein
MYEAHKGGMVQCCQFEKKILLKNVVFDTEAIFQESNNLPLSLSRLKISTPLL